MQPSIPHRDWLYQKHVSALAEATGDAIAAAGYDRLLLHSGRAHARFLDDYEPAFRAHGHFVAWLPLPQHADCLLEVVPGATPVLWLLLPDDFWHAPPARPEAWWADHFDVRVVADPSGWREALAPGRATALVADPCDFADLDGVADLNPPALLARLDEIRTRKTEWQVACIAEANRIALTGHRAAAEAFAAGASELDIHLAYLAAAGIDPDTLPYGSLVGLNEHAAILHYQVRDAVAPAERRSFLIDAGADCHGYAADITRTHAAAPGMFADLIEALDRMQKRLVGRMQIGRNYVDLHLEAHRGIAEILRDTGLSDLAIEALVEDGLTSTFLPHGLGHFLGAQVHDVAGRVARDGTPLPPPERHPFLRLTRELESGNVLTVEPGLYFVPSLLEKLRNSPMARHFDWNAIDTLVPYGGIRIEDNVLVDGEAPRNLTREAETELQGK